MSGGIVVGLIGWTFAVVTCVLPMWKITAFTGSNIITSQVIYEGILMVCLVQSTGQMQCKVYDILWLPSDLLAARSMTIISIITAVLSLTISIMASICTSCSCFEDKTLKRKVMIISGVFLMIAGFLMLIPVAWTTKEISQGIYNPPLPLAQRRAHGASLYTGFIAAFLLITGGALQCCTRPQRRGGNSPE